MLLNLLYCRFDEKRYTSACVEPPVPKLFFAQMDALNDCLVMENLSQVVRKPILLNLFLDLNENRMDLSSSQQNLVARRPCLIWIIVG